MVFVALVFGTAAGVVAGLLGYRRVRAGRTSMGVGAAIAFLTVSLVALWPMPLLVTMFPATEEAPTNSSRVFETCLAWLAYVTLAYLLYWIVRHRAFRQREVGPSPRASRG